MHSCACMSDTLRVSAQGFVDLRRVPDGDAAAVAVPGAAAAECRGVHVQPHAGDGHARGAVGAGAGVRAAGERLLLAGVAAQGAIPGKLSRADVFSSCAMLFIRADLLVRIGVGAADLHARGEDRADGRRGDAGMHFFDWIYNAAADRSVQLPRLYGECMDLMLPCGV